MQAMPLQRELSSLGCQEGEGGDAVEVQPAVQAVPESHWGLL